MPLTLNRRVHSICSVAIALALLSPVTEGAPGKPDTEFARLAKLRDAERYLVKTPLSRIEAGAARIHVRSSREAVRRTILTFEEYPAFIPRFTKSRVVGRSAEATDVYLQVPILHGAAKIWAVVRFAPPRRVGAEEQIRGTLVRGNVERLDVLWRILPIDAANTQLNLEMLIVPKLQIAAKVIANEVAYAADTAVVGTRDRAEKQQASDG